MTSTCGTSEDPMDNATNVPRYSVIIVELILYWECFPLLETCSKLAQR